MRDAKLITTAKRIQQADADLTRYKDENEQYNASFSEASNTGMPETTIYSRLHNDTSYQSTSCPQNNGRVRRNRGRRGLGAERNRYMRRYGAQRGTRNTVVKEQTECYTYEANTLLCVRGSGRTRSHRSRRGADAVEGSPREAVRLLGRK